MMKLIFFGMELVRPKRVKFERLGAPRQNYFLVLIFYKLVNGPKWHPNLVEQPDWTKILHFETPYEF